MRRKHAPVTAIQTLVPLQVKFETGAQWTANPGDWIITIGESIIDVRADKDLLTYYEDIVEGTMLPRATCVQIEAVTGIGTTRNALELQKAIDRLASIAIGGINLQFTPGQLEEIRHRAQKRGTTVEQELQRVVDRIKDELFFRT